MTTPSSAAPIDAAAATSADLRPDVAVFILRAQPFHFGHQSGISMFETVIRILGGLLSAFELSREPVFLKKAKELADKMMYAFERHRTGLPCRSYTVDTLSPLSPHHGQAQATYSGPAAPTVAQPQDTCRPSVPGSR